MRSLQNASSAGIMQKHKRNDRAWKAKFIFYGEQITWQTISINFEKDSKDSQITFKNCFKK